MSGYAYPSDAMSDALVTVGGPELDEDLAAMFMLDEYAIENDLDAQQWSPVTPSPSPSSPSPSSVDLEESKSSPMSPSSLDEREDPAAEQDRRRRRHRESMARYRQEQRTRVDGMKAQEKALQGILTQVLAHNKHIDNSSESRTSLQRYQMRYAELVRSRETLMMERRDLSEKLVFHDQRARAFESISDQSFHKSLFVFPRTPDGVWLRYEEGEAPFYYEPIKEELCRKTIALGLKKMAELLRKLPHQSLPQPVISSSYLLGWNTERVFTTNERNLPVMLFRFSRRVSKTQATLDEMQQRSWKIYTSPDVMSRSSSQSVRTQVVQQVHEDIVIMIRNAPEKQSTGGRTRYLGLYHKMRSGEDNPRTGRAAMIFTMLMNRAPREETPDLTESVRQSGNWMKDGCALLRMTEKPTTPSNRVSGIDVEYMGYVECRDLTHGEHMWTELCLLMLLWERAVAPQSLLTSG